MSRPLFEKQSAPILIGNNEISWIREFYDDNPQLLCKRLTNDTCSNPWNKLTESEKAEVLKTRPPTLKIVETNNYTRLPKVVSYFLNKSELQEMIENNINSDVYVIYMTTSDRVPVKEYYNRFLVHPSNPMSLFNKEFENAVFNEHEEEKRDSINEYLQEIIENIDNGLILHTIFGSQENITFTYSRVPNTNNLYHCSTVK